jgi:hypothetical protein
MRHGEVGSPDKYLDLHNMSHTKEYHAWQNMRARCNNRSHINYKNYGGRGIKVCDAWNKSFMAFYKDMGDKPSETHSIDRIDNSKGYYPENCRWATNRQQVVNRRSNNNFKTSGIVLRKSKKGLDKYIVRVCVNYKVIHIGVYNSLQDAILAKINEEKKYATI